MRKEPFDPRFDLSKITVMERQEHLHEVFNKVLSTLREYEMTPMEAFGLLESMKTFISKGF